MIAALILAAVLAAGVIAYAHALAVAAPRRAAAEQADEAARVRYFAIVGGAPESSE